MDFLAQFTSASLERTRATLDAALDRWEQSTGDVIYSGIWGWLDSQTGRFDNDPAGKQFPEDWEHPTGGMRRMIRRFNEMWDAAEAASQAESLKTAEAASRAESLKAAEAARSSAPKRPWWRLWR